MIGKAKTTEAGHSQEKISTLIGAGAVFNGDITVQDAMRVDGTVNGNCTCKGNFILGTAGVVEGNISAQDVMVSGQVTGDILSAGKLEILSTGKVKGDITARRLVIDEDAHFDGRCIMTSDGQTNKKAEKPGK